MTLSRDILDAVARVASDEGLEPAALQAVVTVESSGRPYEAADGRSPVCLFERHVFQRELKRQAPQLLRAAQRAGLAIPKWLGPGSSQYADQRTSAGRLAVLKRARAIHDEAALDATSFGLFQVLGSNAAACGYPSAVAMYEALVAGGVEAQVRAGVAFIRAKGLVPALERHDWRAFAKGYNGLAYERNAYHTKLSQAYATAAALARTPAPAAAPGDMTLRLGASGPRVKALQEALTSYGVPVRADGAYGPGTRGAVSRVQVELGMTGTGEADPAFVQALESAEPAPVPAAATTVSDLRAEGSRTVAAADAAKVVAAGGGALGFLGDLLPSSVSDAVDKAGTARSALEAGQGVLGALDPYAAWIASHWPALALLGVSAGVFLLARQVVAARLDDRRSGKAV